jgi:hypothetical protein
MTDVETRLRDALDARAAAVTYDADAYAAILRRRGRRRFGRLAVPVGAVAATAAVVGLVAVSTRTPTTLGPAGGGPARVATIRDGRAVVLDGADLDGPPVAELPASFGVPADVAAADGGRTFYVAAGPERQCESDIVRLDPQGRVTPVLHVRAAVTSIAVSPDGGRLAYGVVSPRSGQACGQGATYDLRVRNLRTGTEKVWRGRLGLLPVRDLSWSPDGRYVAFHSVFNASRVDTRGAGGRRPEPFAERFPSPYGPGHCYAHAVAYRPTGDLVALVGCSNDGSGDPRTTRGVVVDPVTGRLGEVLFRLPDETGPLWLTFDPARGFAYLGVRDFEHPDTGTGDARLYVWEPGERPVRVSGAPPVEDRLIW